MTISDTAIKFRYLGNASTDTFAFSGKAFTEDDLVVEIITRATDVLEETLTLTTDYSVTILTDGTGSIVTVAGKIPDNLQDIQIRRDLDKSQTTSLPVGTPFPAKLVENSIDRNTGLIQELGETLSRAVTFPITSSIDSPTFPTPVDDAVIVFDGTTGSMKTGATNTSLIAGAAAADASATAAAASASAASTSETNAAASATKLTGTSTTSLAIAVASKVFTTQDTKFFDAGNFLLITSDANPTNYMHGQVTSYSGTTLTVNITNIGGTGTFADWTIRVSGTRGTQGAQGAAGSIGDLTSAPTGNIATGDFLIYQDIDDSDISKRDTVQSVIDVAAQALYPVGTIYMNKTDATNPGTLLGFGTWVAITEKFIVSRGGPYTATGGAATVSLSGANNGPHSHSLNARYYDSTKALAGSNFNEPTKISAGAAGVATLDLAVTTAAMNSSGSGTAFNIIPPYQAVYTWERTA